MKKKLKQKLGRPRKIKGVISESKFARVRIAIGLYDEERKNGQKHSAAVSQTVELIKLRYPMIRISETEVKRILASWHPRESHNNLLIEGLTYTEEERANDSRLENPTGPSDVISRNSVTRYQVRFGKRPSYPRHNRKPPKG